MLAWELGNEPDLYGYKVFAGNAKNRDFYQVNSLVIEGNIFLDKISLNTLTEEIYYYVTALDFRSNASVHSDTIKLAKPDIIPPTPIAFKRYQTASDSIYLSWAASSSKDVMAYYLLRKSPEEAKYTALKRLALNTTTYTDKAVKIGETYDYAVLTIDDAGLPSMPSAPLRLTCVDRGLRQGITDLAGELNTKEATFNLSWSAPVNKDATVVIYRNDNRKGLEVLTKIPATQTTYTDETLYNNGGQFDYAVKVLYPNGGESLLSNVVTLQLK
jgi:fibronectin type 3 domain-containing protein